MTTVVVLCVSLVQEDVVVLVLDLTQRRARVGKNVVQVGVLRQNHPQKGGDVKHLLVVVLFLLYTFYTNQSRTFFQTVRPSLSHWSFLGATDFD